MRRSLLIVGGPLLLAVACQTVDLGQPPSDINACRPSETYYVYGPSADAGVGDAGTNGGIWTDVLTKEFNVSGTTRHCNDQACHGSGSTNSLRLSLPGCLPTDPNCTIPIPLTMEWADNYRATSEQMNCANVMSSKLIALPGGIQPHGGGKLFEPDGPEASIIIGWVGALP
jgi:hypothetical protein